MDCQIFFASYLGMWGLITISSGPVTEIDTAEEGLAHETTLRIVSGIVNCPRSRIILIICFIISEYQKICICQPYCFLLFFQSPSFNRFLPFRCQSWGLDL